MKSCENCGVPQEKRPGVCLEFMAKYTDGPYNCWKPIVCKTCQGTGKICDKCGVCWDKCKNNAHIGIPELIPCPTCQRPKKPDKTCGNCGWLNKKKTNHSIVGDPDPFHLCEKLKMWMHPGWTTTKHTDCQWKPICETCGGTGTVCYEHCEFINTNCRHSECGHRDLCPTCQPKEERLMVPVRWEKSKANEENSVLITNAGVIGSVTVTMDGLAFRATAVDKIIQDTSLSNHGGTKRFDDEQQAQKAVEKALGIKRG